MFPVPSISRTGSGIVSFPISLQVAEPLGECTVVHETVSPVSPGPIVLMALVVALMALMALMVLVVMSSLVAQMWAFVQLLHPPAFGGCICVLKRTNVVLKSRSLILHLCNQRGARWMTLTWQRLMAIAAVECPRCGSYQRRSCDRRVRRSQINQRFLGGRSLLHLGSNLWSCITADQDWARIPFVFRCNRNFIRTISFPPEIRFPQKLQFLIVCKMLN